MEIHMISGESKIAEREPNKNQANKAEAEHAGRTVKCSASASRLWEESGLWADEDAGPVCCHVQ